jgi:rhodanese-related sulfurtransferase
LTLCAAGEDNTGVAVPRISKEELKQRLDGPADSHPVIIDARLKYPYEHSTVTLPGAIRLAPGATDTSRLSPQREIVVYDSDPGEIVSARVASQLIGLGFRAMALTGGIADWVNAKLPTDSKSAPQAAPPAPGALKG